MSWVLDLITLVATLLMVSCMVFPPEAVPGVVIVVSVYKTAKFGVLRVSENSDLILSSVLLAVWWSHAFANYNSFKWNSSLYLCSSISVHAYSTTQIWCSIMYSMRIAPTCPAVQPDLLQGISFAWGLGLIVVYYCTYGDLFYCEKMLLALVLLGCVLISRLAQRDRRCFPLLDWLGYFGLAYSLRLGGLVRFFRESLKVEDFDWLSVFVLVFALMILCRCNHTTHSITLLGDRRAEE